MKIESNGGTRWRIMRCIVSSAGPTSMITRDPTPARSMLVRATAACVSSSSRLMTVPSSDKARASHVVL